MVIPMYITITTRNIWYMREGNEAYFPGRDLPMYLGSKYMYAHSPPEEWTHAGCFCSFISWFSIPHHGVPLELPRVACKSEPAPWVPLIFSRQQVLNGDVHPGNEFRLNRRSAGLHRSWRRPHARNEDQGRVVLVGSAR
jgi:hypothetical protein